MLILKTKVMKLFVIVGVMFFWCNFFILGVNADGYIEEINCPSNIPVCMGSTYDLKSEVSIYPSSDELKSSLRYYSYDTDVAIINYITGIITPKSYGQARIMISCDGCNEFITINVCYPLSGGEIDFNNQTYLLWEKKTIV